MANPPVGNEWGTKPVGDLEDGEAQASSAPAPGTVRRQGQSEGKCARGQVSVPYTISSGPRAGWATGRTRCPPRSVPWPPRPSPRRECRARGDVGRHHRLRYAARSTGWTGQLTTLLLPIESLAASEPGLELVALLALELIEDHEAAFARMAEARTTWNGRSCCSEGMRWRAASTSAGLTSATMTPASLPASAMTSPHGDTIRLWP